LAPLDVVAADEIRAQLDDHDGRGLSVVLVTVFGGRSRRCGGFVGPRAVMGCRPRRRDAAGAHAAA